MRGFPIRRNRQLMIILLNNLRDVCICVSFLWKLRACGHVCLYLYVFLGRVEFVEFEDGGGEDWGSVAEESLGVPIWRHVEFTELINCFLSILNR